MNQVRRDHMSKYIQERGAVTVKELSQLFSDVSLMTIHRDLQYLEEQGSIIRTRGGAMPAAQLGGMEIKVEARMQSHMKSKKNMASKALSLIEEGSAVFFDAGSSTMALAQNLPDIDLNIFTTGPNVAVELSRLTNPTIHLCGGTLNRSNLAVSGASTLEMLSGINIAIAFVGVSGFTLEGGFTCGKEEEMLVKKTVLKKAKKRVILMDSSKCGKILSYTFGSLDDVDYIVSDDGMPDEFAEEVRRAGVVLL